MEEQIGKEYASVCEAFLSLGMWAAWSNLAQSLKTGESSEEARTLRTLCLMHAETCLTAGRKALENRHSVVFQDDAVWQHLFNFIQSNADIQIQTGLSPGDFPQFDQ